MALNGAACSSSCGSLKGSIKWSFKIALFSTCESRGGGSSLETTAGRRGPPTTATPSKAPLSRESVALRDFKHRRLLRFDRRASLRRPSGSSKKLLHHRDAHHLVEIILQATRGPRWDAALTHEVNTA